MSILLELFNKTVEWEYVRTTPTGILAVFVINDLKYDVTLDSQFHPDKELNNPHELFDDIWEIHFAVSGNASTNYSNDEGITGTGNAILVFSTTIEIINHAVDWRHIQTLIFSADNNEPTRVKLYDRMAATFAKNGWRYISNQEIKARSASPDIDLVNDYILTKHPKPVSESILLELFDKHAPWEYVSTDDQAAEITAAFTVEDNDGVEMLYEVNFVEEADEAMLSTMDTPFLPNSGSVYDINFTAMVANSRYGTRTLHPTGGGNEYLVFATVLEIIHKTLNRHGINNITFSGAKKEQSRTKLYNRMARSLRSEWTIIPPAAVKAQYSHMGDPAYEMWMMARK